ncbi:hypothetical protein B0H11DRAFT_2028126 [Mycena galericulata]|nr:hypothetical protein B0H11DRAFT_2028126 [Mycena galericulata]
MSVSFKSAFHGQEPFLIWASFVSTRDKISKIRCLDLLISGLTFINLLLISLSFVSALSPTSSLHRTLDLIRERDDDDDNAGHSIDLRGPGAQVRRGRVGRGRLEDPPLPRPRARLPGHRIRDGLRRVPPLRRRQVECGPRESNVSTLRPPPRYLATDVAPSSPQIQAPPLLPDRL